MNTDKLIELLGKKEFVEELVSKKTVEDAKAFIKANGLECTDEDAKDVMLFLAKTFIEEGTAEKMDLNDMDAVAGGSASGIVKSINNMAGGVFQMLMLQNQVKVGLVTTAVDGLIGLGEEIYNMFT